MTLEILTNTHSGDVTSDSMLLADFVKVHSGERVIDLGTGCGIIALKIAEKVNADVVGVDILETAIHTAEQNLAHNKNDLRGNVTFLHADVTSSAFLSGIGMCDVVVANPPFYKVNEGRLPPDRARGIQRHELATTLESLVNSAAALLNPDGRLYILHLPTRLSDIACALKKHRFCIVQLKPVFTKRATLPKRILLEAFRQ